MSFQGFSAFTPKCLYLITTLNSPSALPMCYRSSSLLLTAQITRDHTYSKLCPISILLPNKLKFFYFSLQITYNISDHHFCSSFSCLHPAYSFLKVNYPKQDAVRPCSYCEKLKNYSTSVLGYASAYRVQNAFSSLQVKDPFEF